MYTVSQTSPTELDAQGRTLYASANEKAIIIGGSVV